MHYVTLATLLDHSVPVYTWKMFGFPRYDLFAAQISVNLTRETFLVWRERKEWQSSYGFLQPRCMNVQCFQWVWRYVPVSLIILFIFDLELYHGYLSNCASFISKSLFSIILKIISVHLYLRYHCCINNPYFMCTNLYSTFLQVRWCEV